MARVDADKQTDKDLGRLEPEYRDLYLRYRSGDRKALDELLDKLKPQIEYAVRRIGGGIDNPTLMVRGRAIVAANLKRYDPSRASLRSFVNNRLQELQRHYRRLMFPLRIPERAGIEATRIYRAEAELASILGRDPSTDELADYLGISPDKIARIRRSAAVVSTGTVMHGDNPDVSVDPIPGTRDDKRTWLEYAYHSLSERDKLIMEYLYGLRGRPKLSGIEIARKLKVSPAYISQRKRRIEEIIKELKERF